MTDSKEHAEHILCEFFKKSWRVALAEDRHNNDDKCFISADSPSDAAERFAYDYLDDMVETPDIGETVHVAVWIDEEPHCFEVRVIWTTESNDADWPKQ